MSGRSEIVRKGAGKRRVVPQQVGVTGAGQAKAKAGVGRVRLSDQGATVYLGRIGDRTQTVKTPRIRGKGGSAAVPSAGSIRSYYGVEPLERISIIREGIPARAAKGLLADFSIGLTTLIRALNISPATINRKAQGDHRLLPAESERVMGMARLVGQIQAIVDESGDPVGFDAVAWMSRWLTEALPALDGVAPLELLDTMEGQGLVASILARVQSGAYT